MPRDRASATDDTVSAATRRTALLAGGVGVAIENYDLVLYGYFATTIAAQFFPKGNETAALLATLAIFGLGFVVRPVAGLLWGHIGDRVGRRSALAASVVVSSTCTPAVGLLPTYASAGVAAPSLLLVCRLGQTFGASGEYAGANAFVIEYAPEGRRGRYAAAIPLSVGLGLLVGAVLSLGVVAALPAAAVTSWGWRLPFLLAGPFGMGGLYLRLRIEDSPEFTAVRRAGEMPRVPLVEAFRVARRGMLVLFGWATGNAVVFYVFANYFITYLTKTAGLSTVAANGSYLLALVVYCGVTVPLGILADRIGRKVVAVASAVGVAVWVMPCFLLLRSGGFGAAVLGESVYAVFVAGVVLSTSVAIVELFPAAVRVSGSSLSYNLAYTAFGGTAPFVAATLTARGGTLAPGYYVAAISVVAAFVAAAGLGAHTRATID